MPLNSTRGAASAKAFGFTSGISWDGLADYLVIAGGGAGGSRTGGGGGAGGYRTSFPGGTKITIAKGTTPITVGAGGTGPSNDADLAPSRSGTDSILGTYITSTAGGGGATPTGSGVVGAPGGSGGGTGDGPGTDGGAGNTPAVPATPLMPNGQGYKGGNNIYGPWGLSGTGGGGAGAAGADLPASTPQPSPGGNGLSNSISGSSVTYAGGGGAGGRNGPGSPPSQAIDGSPGGAGGGGAGARPSGTPGTPATAGTFGSGGGGGGGHFGGAAGGSGGGGIIIIRAPKAAANQVTVSPGTNTKTTAPNGDTILTFTVTGSLVVT
jgi:hypothetical protein